MEKKLHYISGLPRSGSTLLCNILAQNPRFHATATSGLPEIIAGVKNGWDVIAPHRAMDDEKSQAIEKNVLQGITASYYQHEDVEVVFDKSRAWPTLIETMDALSDYDTKIILTVRDIREILASFEVLHQSNSVWGKTGLARQHPAESNTMAGRANVLLGQGSVLGSAYQVMMDMLQRGWGNKHVHLIDFDNLTTDPETTVRMLYVFLDEPNFEHDFKNVQQTTVEDDRAHGIRGLHDIRQEVLPVASKWEDTLGEWARAKGELNFWKH